MSRNFGESVVGEAEEICGVRLDCPPSAHVESDPTSHESRTLAALRDTLLPKLISGELRAKDATKVVVEAT